MKYDEEWIGNKFYINIIKRRQAMAIFKNLAFVPA